MSDRAAYSRVYWTVLDDDKFDPIRSDMRHFGSWTLMLVIADMSYPAPAFVPPSVPRASLQALSEAGLIESLPARMYRVKGLKAEREKRALAATRTGPKGTPPAPQPGPTRDPNGPQDETSTRRDKTSNGRTGAQERPAPVDPLSQRRFEGMMKRRVEWYRQTGQWEEDWGPMPEGVSRGAA